ncbi:MAG: hypothetical protein IIW08_05820, partial [Clostridia bacterium]|nr:hypothetical protein [Clostridia bacterium]
LTEEQADEILKFIAIGGTNAQVLDALQGYAGKDEIFDQLLIPEIYDILLSIIYWKQGVFLR